MSGEVYDRLKSILTKERKSFGEFVREALEVETRNFDEARGRGYRQGFRDAKERYAVYAYCAACYNGVPVTWEEMKDEAGLLLSNEFTILHKDCKVPEGMDSSRVRRFKAKRNGEV